jgi:alpha-mannosidase
MAKATARTAKRAPQRTLHLICNAHLDPVWMWEWEEGAAEAISTFRVAADLCEKFPGFVFNHNEAVLYRWIEEYEPALFKRIQKLVKQGRWNIMGGWYLQPDCNMPSGESFVRQILIGKRYFAEKFGVDVTSAMNFDPFGHNRGLPQILAKSGFDSYLFCRPSQAECELPGNQFHWVGLDGSRVLACRSLEGYNSPLGKAHEKVANWLKNNADKEFGHVLWGVGDHGGGPSLVDLQRLNELIRTHKDIRVTHTTPQKYFSELARHASSLPEYHKGLNPWAVGCYTSQIRLKQRHRELENELYRIEKMACLAAAQELIAYPAEEIAEATRDLLFAQFHDILPGSSIQAVEETSLRLMAHGLEILSRVRARAFFALSRGQAKAKDGEIPILVFNPLPHAVEAEIECEFSLADQNWSGSFTQPKIYCGGKAVPTQCEKEASNIPLDWRKRVVFRARLEASSMNRFDCRLEALAAKPAPEIAPRSGVIELNNGALDIAINTATGLIDRYRVGGIDVVAAKAFCPLVISDSVDPWGMTVRSFRTVLGPFTLMKPERAARFAGVQGKTLAPVRVIEDGPVRTVVEALFEFGDSAICQRYLVPKQGSELTVDLRVHWNEKDRMLKLSVPLPVSEHAYVGQVAYGRDELPINGDEAVAQKWVAVVDNARHVALTCINDGTYGSDCTPEELRLSLLRSPAYTAHPIHDRPMLPQDQYSPRSDQGERRFRFWFNGGPVRGRLDAVDAEAAAHNERPYALSFFPSGAGKKPLSGIAIDEPSVQLGCCKRAEDGKGLILRLFEPTGHKQSATVSIPFLKMKIPVALTPFEILSLRIDPKRRKAIPCDLIERPLKRS